jgi:hypothetical protein
VLVFTLLFLAYSVHLYKYQKKEIDMKKFIFVICLALTALTALPVIANGVGEVGTDCSAGVQSTRATVAEASVPAQTDTTVQPAGTSTVR